MKTIQNMPVIPPNAKRGAEGKVSIFNQKTGEEVRRWPVDARELVSRSDGLWKFTPPAVLPVAAAKTVAAVSAPVSQEMDEALQAELDKLNKPGPKNPGKVKAPAQGLPTE